jgi:pyridoxal phosphate enzyme (YggS family)
MTEIDELRAARERVLHRIAEACARSHRRPSDVTLVAVSKTVEVERLRAAIAAGFDVLGENRVQELVAKATALGGVSDGTSSSSPSPSSSSGRVRWHLVGPLQSNKARRAVDVADVIESVDSVGLAQRLDRLVREARGAAGNGDLAASRRLPIYLQVNVDDDPAKFGFEVGELRAALDAIAGCTSLEVAGLMAVGRLVATAEAARPTFVALRHLAEDLRRSAPHLGPGLSMGMSDDFEVAIEEGATVVRVGRAIFGARPQQASG